MKKKKNGRCYSSNQRGDKVKKNENIVKEWGRE